MANAESTYTYKWNNHDDLFGKDKQHYHHFHASNSARFDTREEALRSGQTVHGCQNEDCQAGYNANALMKLPVPKGGMRGEYLSDHIASVINACSRKNVDGVVVQYPLVHAVRCRRCGGKGVIEDDLGQRCIMCNRHPLGVPH